MGQLTAALETTGVDSRQLEELIKRYGCGPVQFTGTEDALYERHLVFDNVLEAAAISALERFEAVARSVRDILSQRSIQTETTYERKDPKRVYYLSKEFLIGRSLANNVTNLLLDNATKRVLKEQRVDLFRFLETGPRRRLGQWRSWTFGGLFPRFDGYDGNSGHGLWPPLSIRYVQANHPGRLATRSSRQLATSS